MKNLKQLFILSAITLLFIQCKDPVEISQWRGPERDGIYPDINLLDEWPENGPELLWSFDDLGIGYTSASITSDLVYITGTKDSTTFLYAFNHNGELQWEKDMGLEWMKTYPGVRSTPLIYDELGYIFNGLGVLQCFDAKTGDMKWEIDFLKDHGARNIQHGFTENLLIDGDKLYVTPGGEDLNIAAVNRITGEFIWTSKVNGEKSAYCSPNLINHNGNKYLITMLFNSLISINAETGELAWEKELTEEKYGIHANIPIYHEGYLFAVEGWLYGAFKIKLSGDGSSYTDVWKVDSADAQLGDAVLLNDKIYVSSASKNEWYCIDWNTGEIDYSTDTLKWGAIIAADDKLYMYATNGELALVDPKETEFEIKGKFNPGGSKRPDHFAYPVIHDQKLYIRYINNLWVYDIAKS